MSSNHRLKLNRTISAFHALTVLLFLSLKTGVGAEGYPPGSFDEVPTAGNPFPEGSAKVLLCKSDGDPTPAYRWLKDSAYITNASSSYSHRINSISRADTGEYRCEASNQYGAVLSSAADIKVAYLDPFEGRGLQYTLTTNTSQALVIDMPKINSYPSPIITWHKNQEAMNKAGAFHQITLDGALVLLDRRISDSSNYYKIVALNGITYDEEVGPDYYVVVTVTATCFNHFGHFIPDGIHRHKGMRKEKLDSPIILSTKQKEELVPFLLSSPLVEARYSCHNGGSVYVSPPMSSIPQVVISALKKKTTTLAAFEEDVQWAESGGMVPSEYHGTNDKAASFSTSHQNTDVEHSIDLPKVSLAAAEVTMSPVMVPSEYHETNDKAASFSTSHQNTDVEHSIDLPKVLLAAAEVTMLSVMVQSEYHETNDKAASFSTNHQNTDVEHSIDLPKVLLAAAEVTMSPVMVQSEYHETNDKAASFSTSHQNTDVEHSIDLPEVLLAAADVTMSPVKFYFPATDEEIALEIGLIAEPVNEPDEMDINDSSTNLDEVSKPLVPGNASVTDRVEDSSEPVNEQEEMDIYDSLTNSEEVSKPPVPGNASVNDRVEDSSVPVNEQEEMDINDSSSNSEEVSEPLILGNASVDDNDREEDSETDNDFNLEDPETDDSYGDPLYKPRESDMDEDIVSGSEDSDNSTVIDFYPAITGSYEKTQEEENIESLQCTEDDDVVASAETSTQSDECDLVKTLQPSGDTNSHTHSNLPEETICRDRKFPCIYIRKGNSDHGGEKKRVYDNYHCCLVCKQLKSNIRKHILSHKEHPTVKRMIQNEGKNQKEKERLMAIFRNAGDNAHNVSVCHEKKGELIVSRRVFPFDYSEYGPCSDCLEWIKMGVSATKHLDKCPASTSDKYKLTKGQMVVRSNVIKGLLAPEASEQLIANVYPIMTRDEVTEIAQKDSLIVALGNFVFRQNINNKSKRKYTTSSRMRAAARLVKFLKEKHGSTMSMSDFLNVDFFDDAVEAALNVASPNNDDLEDLKHPSAAIKAGHDIFQLADIQVGIAVQARNNAEKEEVEGFILLLKKNWSNRVGRLAKKLLRERRMLSHVKLPNPTDLQHLAEYLKEKLDEDYVSYRTTAEYSLCRLLLYNKRRSGELENTLKVNYIAKSSQMDEYDEALMGDLTELEKKILGSQELMKIEGKGQQIVPVIIPTDTTRALQYITNDAVRKSANVKEDNPYLFATTGSGPIRAYEALKRVCDEVKVTTPDAITSVNLRKYFATMTQVIGLKDHELGWLCKHLGHSVNVHKLHYRAASGYIERMNIGKLMLLQDFNVASHFKDQRLEDIHVEDILKHAEHKETTYDRLESLNDLESEPQRDASSLTTTSVSPRQAPTLVIGPQNQILYQDPASKVDFECVFNARPVAELQIFWYRITDVKNQIFADNKYLISSIGQRTLTIVSPDVSDSGVYQCEAFLSGFDRVVASANLTVYVGPTLTSYFNGKIPKDFGETVTINCTASGVPSPTIHWYFNAKEIGKDFNSSSYTLHTNGSLTVSQLDLEHDGVYQCFLRNVAGETSKATWLKVNSSPPQMITPPSNITTLEGENARFTCETRGAPKPTVRWSKEIATGVDQEITDSGRFQILERGHLLIVSTEREDSGIYTCNSSNSQGHISASASLNVYMRTQIIRPPQDQRIIKGSTATFYCGVSHDPNIQVTWKWSHRALHQESGVEIILDSTNTVAPDGTLTIHGINNNHIGDYTCHVTSSGGNDTRTVSLTVIELPQAPVITSVVLHQDDVRAVIVRWNPAYDGNTPITKFSVQYKEVLYGNDGSSNDLGWITHNADIQPDIQEATVTGLRPARYYQFRVFASNEVGEGLPSDPKPDPALEMPQQPPSSPPKGFFGMPRTNTSVLLGWQPPNENTWNGPLQGYTIQYKLSGYPNSTFQRKTVTLLSVNPRYELKGLAYYQEYEIQIAAYNIEGVGMFSSLTRVKTLEGHPTAPPENLEVIAMNSTAVRVSWTPPNQQFINGRNLGYKVLGRRLEGVQSEFVIVVPQDTSNPTGIQETVLPSLLKYTEYNITVLCYTSQGDGPKALPKTVRTAEDVPSQVGSLTFSDIRATSLKVNWSPPTEINGILTGYTLLYEKKNTSGTQQRVDLPPSNLGYTVFNLSPMTKYTISVFASTGVGPGPVSSADIESGVPPELPTAPYNLGVSNIAARSVLLQFLPGFDGKTSITLWIVEALEGADATEWKVIYQVSDPTARSLQVQNLKPYRHYKLRITAENIVGQSNPSEPTRLFQTIQDAPGAPPGNVTVRALNATALRVSWTPLAKNDWNGEPRGYKLYYKLKEATGNFQVVNLDNGMNLDSAILRGLQEWMQYEVKMIAYNDVGNSDFSPVTIERTRESVPSEGPQNVQAVAISSTSVNVTWGDVPTLEQNGMILGFKVEYRSSERDIPTQSQDVAGNTTHHVALENLRKFVVYEIRVLAYTRMGDGVPSAPEVVVQTNADVPGPPQFIWFPDVSYSVVTIVWQPPAEPNGIITGYMVSYKLRDSPTEYVNSSTLSSRTFNYTVGSLQRQAFYEFRVTAKTTLGWGETASVEVFTMVNRSAPDSPSKPTIKSSQVQARSVTISWIPAPFNGYGPLRNFTVQYKDGQSWVSVKEPIPPTITTYPVQGLRPNTVHVFRVAATNDIGTSPFSVQSDSVRTLEDYPVGAPRFVSVERLTTTSVKVTWEQPLPNTWNGDLLGYKLMYRQAENDNFMEVEMPVDSTEKVLQNLVKFVNYEFLVNAFNAIGSGPTSTPVTVFVGEAAPTAAPDNVQTQAINSTEIRVTWQPPPPDTQNGELSGYRISYWRRADPESTAKQVTSREQTALLVGLDIYTEYAISVQAINLAGEGPKSPVKYEKTLEGLPGKPASLTFWNVTYESLDLHWEQPLHPNGRTVNYELSYLELNSVGGSKLVKFNVSGTLAKLTIKDLRENITYMFSVAARNAVGQGGRMEKSVTVGPQSGSPEAPYQLRVRMEPSGQKLILDWLSASQGTMPVYRHFIQAKQFGGYTNRLNDLMYSNQWAPVKEIGLETQAEVNLLQFNPDTQYQLRVIAMSVVSASPYSNPSQPFKTPATATPDVADDKPFHYEWWFLVIVALTGLIIILVVISLLCLVGRRNKTRQRKTAGLSSTSNLAPSVEPEEGGFSNFEMTQGRQSTHSRRQKYAGIRNGSANNIYARSPPRPSPASVAYSDNDSASAAKPPLPDDDDDDTVSSCTQKPSELGDSSEASDEASDDDNSFDLPPPPPPASPPPPPFSHAVRNPYASGGATAAPEPSFSHPYMSHRAPELPERLDMPDRGVTNNSSWQNQNNSSFNAYQYTDSEAESSHYAYSLNGGQVVLNNTAGSRAPLPGFSSFV